MADLSHLYAFDPTYGYTLDQLLTITPPVEPADFESFWRPTYDETLAVPLRTEAEDLPSPRPDFRVRLLRFDSFGGVRIGGWLVTPTDGPIARYVVNGHGYYNRSIEDVAYHANTASLFFGCRGLGVSRVDDISDQTGFHVLHGIDDKSTYVHRGCVADTWAAATALLKQFPEAADRLEYFGESFGGGIGAMALAWDGRFHFARLNVPSFGHHPLRLQCRCTGSGQAVRRKLHRHPELYDRTLRYFDSAVHASRIRVPTHFACARFDPAVPPPGQFAVHNAATCEKKLTVWRTGHHDWPGSAEDVRQAAEDAETFRLRFR